MSMRMCVVARIWIVLLICCLPLWAQDDAPADAASDSAQAQASSQDDSAPQPASYDDVATPGQIHGFIPDTWTGGMVTLADLQTQEGQDWLNGLTAAQSAQGQTQYVCQNPGPTTTSSNTGDFYFYDLPAGSYAIAGCMQTPDGHWRSGAQVLSLDAGQDELVALGPNGGPLMRDGQPFVPAYYVGLWEPMWFGPGWSWGWHSAAGWQASVYYHVPAYRSAPLWVRPVPIVVGARIVVPPYKLVIAGNYHYLAFRNGAFVRESPRMGYVLPPVHVFHPITPSMEVRMHTGFQARPGVFGGVQVNAAAHASQPVSPVRPSPFVNYHPTPVVVNTPQPNNGTVRTTSGSSPGYVNSGPGNTYHPPVQNNPNPQYTPQPQYTPPPAPRPEYHPAPPPREEYHAPPAPSKPAITTKKPY
jgi:hypothetical protein